MVTLKENSSAVRSEDARLAYKFNSEAFVEIQFTN